MDVPFARPPADPPVQVAAPERDEDPNEDRHDEDA